MVFPLSIFGFLVFEVLLSSSNHARSPGDWSRNKHCEMQSNERTKEQSDKSINFCLAGEHVTPIAKLSRHDASLYIFADNEAVIKKEVRRCGM